MKGKIALLLIVVALVTACSATVSPPTATPMVPPTQTSYPAQPAPTSMPVPTSAPLEPSASMPAGWLLVESKDAGGVQLSFNHDNDGSKKMLFLTWGNITASGASLGQRTLRVTLDPAGEKISTNGGWQKFQWQGRLDPTPDQIAQLVSWRNTQLGYTVSYQTVTTAPYQPKSAAQPSDWVESRQPKFTGDKVVTTDVNLDNEVAISWFHAREGGKDSAGSCTMFVMTKSGSTTYQGGLRFWKLVSGGSYTNEQLKVLVDYWKGVLEKENRGTCPNYSVSQN